MLRALTVFMLCSTTLFAGVGKAAEVSARDAAATQEATPAEWAAFGQDLAELQATLATAESVLESGGIKDWRWKQCRFQQIDHAIWTAREERITAQCIEDRWRVPGGLAEVMQVISCESGWSRLAYNPAGPYVGLGQHALSAWAGRVRAYEPPLWNLDSRWTNSRTMLTVTIRMAHNVGWGPWSCA